MKSLIPCLMVVFLCISVTFGAFDYTISDTYNYGIDLNSESLLVTGSGSLQIRAKGESYVEVQDTAPLVQFKGGIYSLGLDDLSTMNYYGGEMGGFSIYDDAEAVFSGGRINYISSHQRPLTGDYPPSYWDKHIEIICKTYDYNTSTKLLTGTWADDSVFNIQLVDQSGYYSAFSNIEFTIIPEPTTLSLLTLGAFLAGRKRKA